MHEAQKIIGIVLFVLLNATGTFAQNDVIPITNYSFNNNSVVDEMGYSELFLRNNAVIYLNLQRKV